ncbi:dihydroorotase [Peijinzhouia sedimentorum]
MKILLKNVSILDPRSIHNSLKKNILIENGVIKSISDDILSADKLVDAGGGFVSPGWFDMQAHFADPGFEHKEDLESGANAAAAGGFTGVAILPNTKPVIQSKNAVTSVSKGNPHRLVQIFPIAAVSLETEGEDLTEMLDLSNAGAVAFSDGLKPVWHPDILLKSLQYLQPINGLLINRPEDKLLSRFGTMHEGLVSTHLGLKGIPSLAEELMVARDIEILRYTNGRIHFSNISCEGSVQRIKEAKAEGMQITCDVAAHQLLFTDEDVADFDTNHKVNPPLRSKRDREALIEGLKDGTIDVIVSSHQPQDVESKNLEFDLAENGIIALQTVYPILNSLKDQLSIELLIDKLALAPRKLLGLEVPTITEGAEANLSIFHPDTNWTFDKNNNFSKSENSPFFGKELKGKVIGVIRGEFQEFYI